MQLFDLAGLLAERARTGRPWLEFLRVASLSVGVYHLKAGQADPQQPHTEDEVYYVASGRGRFRAGEEQSAVGPGSRIGTARDYAPGGPKKILRRPPQRSGSGVVRPGSPCGRGPA